MIYNQLCDNFHNELQLITMNLTTLIQMSFTTNYNQLQ
jgi:hypothetical protein